MRGEPLHIQSHTLSIAASRRALVDLPEYEHALKTVCGDPTERGRKSKARSSVSASSSTYAAQHDRQAVVSSQSSFEMPSTSTELADLLAEYGVEIEADESLSQQGKI